MISILIKGRDIPRDGCGGHPGGEQCFSYLYGVKIQDFVIVPELILDSSRSHWGPLEAGGKPSTWFPPEETRRAITIPKQKMKQLKQNHLVPRDSYDDLTIGS